MHTFNHSLFVRDSYLESSDRVLSVAVVASVADVAVADVSIAAPAQPRGRSSADRMPSLVPIQ